MNSNDNSNISRSPSAVSTLTARGGKNKKEQESSPPTSLSTSLLPSDKHKTNNKTKDKAGSGNPDVLSIDLMTPITDLQNLAYFGDSFTTYAVTTSESPTEQSTIVIPRSTTPTIQQRRKSQQRIRASFPDKSLPPIHTGSGDTSGEEAEPTRNSESNLETTARERISTPQKTSRAKYQVNTAFIFYLTIRKPQLQQSQEKKSGTKKGSVTVSEVQLFNKTAVNIADSINHLKSGLQDVEKAIKVDNEIIQKYSVSLQQLELKRESLLCKIKEKEEWLKKYSHNVQPLQEQILGLYEKVGHVRASLGGTQKTK